MVGEGPNEEEGVSPMVLDDVCHKTVPLPGEKSSAKRGDERPGARGVMEVVVERIEYDLPFTHILHRRTPSPAARNTRAVVTTGSGDEVVVERIFRWK